MKEINERGVWVNERRVWLSERRNSGFKGSVGSWQLAKNEAQSKMFNGSKVQCASRVQEFKKKLAVGSWQKLK